LVVFSGWYSRNLLSFPSSRDCLILWLMVLSSVFKANSVTCLDFSALAELCFCPHVCFPDSDSPVSFSINFFLVFFFLYGELNSGTWAYAWAFLDHYPLIFICASLCSWDDRYGPKCPVFGWNVVS
jgi:hypothetical protein